MNYYEQIPPIKSLLEIANPSNYRDVPEDWLIAITDVENSTAAIEEGRYKDVNGVAVASITALLNLLPGVDIPFVFGGDGATVLLPPEVEEQAWNALKASQEMAQLHFRLRLRAGIITVREVLADGYTLKVTRLRMSDNFHQAIFSGAGLSYAENRLKAQTVVPYAVGHYEADFSGFECRWQEIPSKYEENVSLIIKAMGENPTAIYLEVLEEIAKIYGDSTARHPLSLQNMRIALNPLAFRTEARVRWGGATPRTLLNLWLNTIGGFLFFKYRERKWSRYQQVVLEATDNEKFDGVLRMIISGAVSQRETLHQYLEDQVAKKRLVYGVHLSDKTLMTCLVFDRFGRQVHFVDGAGGGYALAAKAMKQMEKSLYG